MELSKLQIKPLSGSVDWPIWKRRIRDFLDYHDEALNVIDGKFVKPDSLADDATEEQRKQFKVKLSHTHTGNLSESMDKETAREVWDELKRNFEASSKDQLFRLCADFFSFS